jgi:hypothetical protein
VVGISAAGTLTTNQELELVTADLHSLVIKLRHSFHITGDGLPLTGKEQEEQETFQKICNEAMEVAEELLERLDKLRVKRWQASKMGKLPKSSKECLVQGRSDSLSSATTKLQRGIGDANPVLDHVSNSMRSSCTHANITLRLKLDVESLQASSRFDSLDRQTQIIISSLADKDRAQEISDRLNALTQLVSRWIESTRIDTATFEK